MTTSIDIKPAVQDGDYDPIRVTWHGLGDALFIAQTERETKIEHLLCIELDEAIQVRAALDKFISLNQQGAAASGQGAENAK